MPAQWRSQNLVVVGALERWTWGKVSPVPSPRGRGWGGGCARGPENLWIFGVKMTCFWCIFGTILSNLSSSAG